MLVCLFHFACEAAGAMGTARALSAPRDRGLTSLRCHAPLQEVSSRGGDRERSSILTIFWRCGDRHFSSRKPPERLSGNEPSTVLAEDSSLQLGSGNADSQRKVWSSGWSGRGRPYPCDSGCVPAHPPYWRAAASYRPLRAVWAVCAWALRGSRELIRPFSAHKNGAPPKRNFQR